MAGPDRPGLVESLSSTISDAGGNWEGSRMARLSGQFAGVVNVMVAPAKVDSLRAALDDLSSKDGLLVSMVEAAATADSEVEGEAFALEVVGQDRTGIVKEISRALADLGVNVVELMTECSSAPMSGERLFQADAVIVIPSECSLDKVQEQIEEIAHDLAVTILNLED